MPLPVVPGGVPAGAPGGSPAAAPPGDALVGAGFDALFQQLTGVVFSTEGAPGLPSAARRTAGEPDADAETRVAPDDPYAGVALPVALLVPVEWRWTPGVVPPPPAADSADGDAPAGGDLLVPVQAGAGAAPHAPGQRLAAGDLPWSTFATTVAKAGPLPEGTTPAAPALPSGHTSASSTDTTASATASAAVVDPSAGVVPAIASTSAPAAGERTIAPTPMPPVQVPAPGEATPRPLPAERRSGASSANAAVEPALDTTAAGAIETARQSLATVEPGVVGGPDRPRTPLAAQGRHGRLDPVTVADAPVALSPDAVAAAAPAPPDGSATLSPLRRPVSAGALAAMERLAVTPAATATTTPAGAAPASNTRAPSAVAASGGGASADDGMSGGAGREPGQPAPDRVATTFRLADTAVLPFSAATASHRPESVADLRAASAEAPLSAREFEPAVADSVHQQIVRSIRMQWTGGLSEARVSLRPEFLGEVTATINVERGVVTATLHADTPEVRAFIESHAASLREALGDHGLRLDRLEVVEPEHDTPTPDRQGHRRRGQQDAPPKPRRRAPVERDGTFELISE